MTLDEYQNLANRTAQDHVLPSESLLDCTLGLCGEAGEVADEVKKVVYHRKTLDVNKITSELGDVLWYVAVLATTINVTLDELAGMNIKKLEGRYPEGFKLGVYGRENDE